MLITADEPAHAIRQWKVPMGKLILYAVIFAVIGIVMWLDGQYDLLVRIESFLSRFDS